MCNVELFNLTGEVKYLDEEGTIVPNIDQLENGKKMREEVTTIEQFEVIGSYNEVAKKYLVSVGTAHGLMKSLRAKKAREDAEMVKSQALAELNKGVVEKSMILEEMGQVQPEVKPQEEIQTEIYCSECGEQIINEMPSEHPGLCNSCYRLKTDEPEDDIKDNWPIVNEWEGVDEEMGAIADELNSPERMIEALWSGVESDLVLIRKMYIKRAEEEFKTRLSGVMAC